MIFGILFFGFLIYEIYCVIQNEQERKQRRKEWEPYHRKPHVISEEEKDKQELEAVVMNTAFMPADLNNTRIHQKYLNNKK